MLKISSSVLAGKICAILLVIALGSSFSIHAQGSGNPLKLWYDRPAEIWEEALPLGNGKMGAMIFGGVDTALVQLNDITLWSGSPISGNNPEAKKYLPRIRKAIFEENYERAEAIWNKMQGPYSARYLPMGDLHLVFDYEQEGIISNYSRELDLNNAISKVKYSVGETDYFQETFMSFPDQMLVMNIKGGKEGSLNLNAALSSPLRYEIKMIDRDHLVLTGKAPKYVAHRNYEPNHIAYDDATAQGMNFEVHLKIKSKGGLIKMDDNSIEVKGSNEVELYITAATSFNGFDKSPGLNGKDPFTEANDLLIKGISQSYTALKKSHFEDYHRLFDRVKLDLGGNEKVVALPTDERLVRFNQGKNDNHLQTLYYQFGRYLLISSSRKGAVPANLQGIWNRHVQPPWGSNYTLNINTEMNYWPAESTNLSECHEPLFGFLENLAVNGSQTAKINYGIEAGWTTHHNSDIWAKSSPAGGFDQDSNSAARWAAWPMSGAWLSLHPWEHFLFTGDKEFLKERAYPLMKGAAQFLLEWLIKDEEGRLVTNPSTSPENTFNLEGKKNGLSMASTMDIGIIRELFSACINASEILNVDLNFRVELIESLELLFPYQIGQYGQLQEWYKDWDDPSDDHRHLSHLFGLFPGTQFSIHQSPKLAAAAKQSLLHRGDVSTGWSMAWKVNWWAHLNDGNHAHKILKDGLTYINPNDDRAQMSGGGTYPNLFDAHPPFQIDGNLGGTAGITEMLVQSNGGEISLLPALPDEWEEGSIEGVKTRGNFEVTMSWENCEIRKAIIKSNLGGNCRIRTLIPVKVVETDYQIAEGSNPNSLAFIVEPGPFLNHSKNEILTLEVKESYVIDFLTQPGKTYTLLPL